MQIAEHILRNQLLHMSKSLKKHVMKDCTGNPKSLCAKYLCELLHNYFHASVR